ncbi:MAG: sigma-70 family RNA polymerase sigma factor [Planctomycetota bacterium]
MSPAASDAVALRRYARNGDPDAFAVLSDRYRGMVLGVCRRVLRNESDAEDAAQETFLKFAQNARKVRSNAAAWLHACAWGTACDLARRSSTLRRHEHAAAKAESADAADDLTWRELEPLIDEALAQLPAADHDLIASRFLAGRSQREMAKEQGVSEGAMSRRLAKAMDRLRGRLNAGGTASISVGALAAALLTVPAEAASPAVSASAAKIGLAGTATRSAGLVLGGVSGAAVVAASILAGTATVALTGVLTFGGGSGSAQPVSIGSSIERPTKDLGPFMLVAATEPEFKDRGLWISSTNMFVLNGRMRDGRERGTGLRILEATPVEDDKKTKDREEVAVLRVSVDDVVPADDEWSRFQRGSEVEISAAFDEYGRIVLDDLGNEVQIGKNEPTWYGVRPPIGWAESGQVPEDPGLFGLEGPWTEAERIPVTIRSREIHFGTDRWSYATYRIIEWEDRGDHSRVLSINAGGRDPRLIATRFPLLVRKVETWHEIAFYPPGSDRFGEWPSSFESTAQNPVYVAQFREMPK